MRVVLGYNVIVNPRHNKDFATVKDLAQFSITLFIFFEQSINIKMSNVGTITRYAFPEPPSVGLMYCSAMQFGVVLLIQDPRG